MSLKTNEDIRKIIIKNILMMLNYRNWITKETLNDLLLNNKNQIIYEIQSDGNSDFVPKTIALMILNQKMNTISKSSTNILNQFLNKYDKFHKMIIFKEYPDKLKNQLEEKFSNIEIFDEEFFKVDIGSHIIVPKHRKLLKKEAEDVVKSYGKESQFPILMQTDPMSRYLYVKPNDMIEIIRPNRNSGYEVFYRIVK